MGAEVLRSAASMDWRARQSEGTATNRQARRDIAKEQQRKTAGPKTAADWAARNPAINLEKTHLNIDMVNDGAGGFEPTRSISQVVAYGDERVARVRPGLQTGHRHTVTSVFHVPWAYLEPDGTEYQVVDQNGDKKFHKKGPFAGQPMMEKRYRVKPGAELVVEGYLQDCLDQTAKILPDGQAGIHGYSIQYDERRPHIQIQCDPFVADPSAKNPQKMRNGFSQAFGSHRHNRQVQARDPETGRYVTDPDGTPRMVRESASRKMERYHEELREFLVSRGYEIDPERDPLRHNRRVGLADYKDLQHEKTEVDLVAQDLGARAVELEDEHAVRVEALAETVMDERNAATAELTAAEQRAAEVVAEAEKVVAEAEVEVAEAHDYAAGTEAQADEHLRAFRQTLSAERAEVLATARTEAEKITTEAQARADERGSELDTRERGIASRERSAEETGYATGHADGLTAGKAGAQATYSQQLEQARQDREEADKLKAAAEADRAKAADEAEAAEKIRSQLSERSDLSRDMIGVLRTQMEQNKSLREEGDRRLRAIPDELDPEAATAMHSRYYVQAAYKRKTPDGRTFHDILLEDAARQHRNNVQVHGLDAAGNKNETWADYTARMGQAEKNTLDRTESASQVRAKTRGQDGPEM